MLNTIFLIALGFVLGKVVSIDNIKRLVGAVKR